MDPTSQDPVRAADSGRPLEAQRDREPPDEGSEPILRCRSCGSTDLEELLSPGGHVRCRACGWSDAPTESPLPTSAGPSIT